MVTQIQKADYEGDRSTLQRLHGELTPFTGNKEFASRVFYWRGFATDPLDPSWGEPELLMSLAWSNLNRATPNLGTAEQKARSALALIPYWHYVRDILVPQIQEAKAKQSGKS